MTVTGTYSGEVKGDKPDGNGVFKYITPTGANMTYTGGFKNGKFDGEYIGQYLDAQTKKGGIKVSKEEGIYKNGLRNGKYKLYYWNGKLCTEKDYKDGKRDGEEKQYYLNGNIENIINYKDDKRDVGKGFFENGQLKWEAHFSKGKGKHFYEGGQLLYEGEIDDTNGRNGQGTLYNMDGSIKYKGKFVNDEPAK